MKFKVEDLLETLEDILSGKEKELVLTGNLKDETPITGSDTITIKCTAKVKRDFCDRFKAKQEQELQRFFKKLRYSLERASRKTARRGQ